jgi:hypothetical protein
MTNIWDLYKEEEERRVEAERKIIAAEDAAWRALPQAERDRISAERQARLEALFGAEDSDEDEDDDDEDEDEDEEDNDDD